MADAGWVAMSNVSAVAGVSGVAASAAMKVGQYLLYVARDGTMIPWYLTGIENQLSEVRKIFDTLTEDQKKRIEELRESSETSLQNLVVAYEAACMQYLMILDERRKAGFVAKLWPWGRHPLEENEELVELRRTTEELRDSTISTTRRLHLRERIRTREVGVAQGGSEPEGRRDDSCPMEARPAPGCQPWEMPTPDVRAHYPSGFEQDIGLPVPVTQSPSRSRPAVLCRYF